MRFIEIYEGTLFQCQMVINLLQNAGIEAVLKDEFTGTRNPLWSPAAGVKVVIFDRDYAEAKIIVESYEKSDRERL